MSIWPLDAPLNARVWQSGAVYPFVRQRFVTALTLPMVTAQSMPPAQDLDAVPEPRP